MKTIVAMALLTSFSAFSSTEIICESTDGKYRIELTHENNIADKITYYKNGNFFKEFNNIPVMEEKVDILFSKNDVLRFTVGFKNFRYFEIDRKMKKGKVPLTGKGVFIPRNFPLSAEYELKCTFSE